MLGDEERFNNLDFFFEIVSLFLEDSFESSSFAYFDLKVFV